MHGSPRDPTNEYVFPEHAYDDRKMKNLFRRVQRFCFQGHTHIPGVFTEDGEFITPEECEYYLCGPPMMNAAVIHMLEELGVERENILLDDFGVGGR